METKEKVLRIHFGGICAEINFHAQAWKTVTDNSQYVHPIQHYKHHENQGYSLSLSLLVKGTMF